MGWTEALRRYLTLRAQDVKIVVKLDRTMMFESQTTFHTRTTRIVTQVPLSATIWRHHLVAGRGCRSCRTAVLYPTYVLQASIGVHIKRV
jgi:hypothetical protein